MDDFRIEPVSIDLGGLLQRSVASLYSNLVTRPTGSAVRLAIETQVTGETAPVTVSVIDFSRVAVLDFSCADEVVAKLLLRFLRPDRPAETFFVLRGIRDLHRHPIEVVLRRQALAAVAETRAGRFEVLGSVSPTETRVWEVLEASGRIPAEELPDRLRSEESRRILTRLVDRRLVFRNPLNGDVHALSSLVRGLG